METLKTTPATSEKITLTPVETAALLGTSRETVYRLLKRGLLKCAPGLRTKLISRVAIDRYLAS
jgi:excisionase family DNA binding protein